MAFLAKPIVLLPRLVVPKGSENERGVKSMKQHTHPSSQEIPTNGFANNQRQEDEEALVMFGLSKMLAGGVIF